MTNTKELRRKIDASGLKMVFIADKCNLTLQGLLNKVDGRSQFRQNEITTIAAVLRLTKQEIFDIFFA